jgi:TM2 domain-containing membrane protein YozV
MNCATHSTVAAVAYCRTCGKPLCGACARDVRGTIFCEPCLAERLGTALPTTPPLPPPGTPGASSVAYPGERLPSPGLAAVLGFIPGVGAMYNGQFMKGFIHVMAFVCMIWMADRFGPIMVPVFFAYFFYLVFDAYKTAHAIELGQPLPDPFGFERMFGPTVQPGRGAATMSSGTQPFGSGYEPSTASPDVKHRSSVPTGAVILIALGVLFLLHTVGWFEFGIDRFWPVILIAFGGWLFAKRWGLLGTEGLACTCDRCKMRCIMWPSIMITLGVLFLMDNLHGPGIERTWPLVLLVIGAVKLLQSNASEAGHVGGPPALPPQAPPPVPPRSDPNASIPSSGEVNHV